MKYFYFLIIAILIDVFTCYVGYSQDKETEIVSDKSLVFGAGYSHFRTLDEQISPLIYYAQLFPVLFEYIKETNNRIMSISLNAGNGLLALKRFPEKELVYIGPDNEGILQEE